MFGGMPMSRVRPLPLPSPPKPTADGWSRSAEREKQLNAAMAQIAQTEQGKVIMGWLREITVGAVMAPTCSDAELRQMEGMRQLYAILCVRLERGEKGE